MLRKITATLLSAALIWSGPIAQVSAAMIETADVLTLDARADRIAAVQAQLAREDVKLAMTQMGVDPLQAQLRVASLSDEELLLLEQELETLPAGGDSFFALVGVVFIILLILEVVGVTNIFKGV